MPNIPFNSPYASAFGFKFDFVDAFNKTATAQGIPINTSFSTLQTSLGSSNDLFPTQQTAWGRANQGVTAVVTLTTPNALGEVGTFNDTPSTNTSLWAYAKQAYITASGGGSVPPGTITGETIVWDGAAWAITGSALRLGRFAGESTQSIYATALGVEAGRYNQGAIATAIGFEAGESNQGTKAIALGNQAGQNNQGVNAIAIGTLAGATNQHDNTIVLNASGAAFSSAQPGALYINPVRNENGNPNWLTYNSMSGEVTFDTALPLSLGASTDAPSLTTSVWAYAQQAESDAQYAIGEAATANSWITTESSPNAVNAIGTYSDTPSLTTSLWAYAQQTQLDAQAATVPNESLRNTVRITPFPTTPVINLLWGPAYTSTINVPLAVSPNNTCLAPIAPTDNSTGWRFTKTYTLIAVGTTPLTLGATYTIITVGNTHWTEIGASANTAGVQFTYNGALITPSSSTGTCSPSTKMSWYMRNMLFGLALPVVNLTYTGIAKRELKNAWFLVKFDADIAQQGTLAIQIETYAFKYTNNTTNEYTGRWAYSFPLQQNNGFTATTTTNLTTSPTVPRLKAGFTYLLYAADEYPSYSPTTYTGARQYLPGGAGLFPSQTDVGFTLRNPYDIYSDVAHLPMSGCQYTRNAIQPTYGTGEVYQDESAVEVAAIYLNTSSTSPSSGVGQTVQDFTVLDWGFSFGSTSVSEQMVWQP